MQGGGSEAGAAPLPLAVGAVHESQGSRGGSEAGAAPLPLPPLPCPPRGGAHGGRRRPVCGKFARGGAERRIGQTRWRSGFCYRPLATSLAALMLVPCRTRALGSFAAQGGGGGTDGLIGMWPLRGLCFNRMGCRMRGGGDLGGRPGLGTDRCGGRRLCRAERSGGGRGGPEWTGARARVIQSPWRLWGESAP